MGRVDPIRIHFLRTLLEEFRDGGRTFRRGRQRTDQVT